MEEIRELLKTAARQAVNQDIEVELTRPDEQFGDYATNVALQLGKKLGQNPREIASSTIENLKKSELISNVEIAGPGFINVTLSIKGLLMAMKRKPQQALKGKVVVTEYSDPNPFKVLHAGHLYTSVVGDAISNLLEAAGAKVHRVNFGGDVGLHVGKTMWAILKKLGGEHPAKLAEVPKDQHSDWMAEAYVEGNNAYDDDEQAKAEIIELNKRVYQLHADNDHDSPFAQIYWTTRTWSYEYFDEFYARIGVKFEKYYPESEAAEPGLRIVKEQLQKGVFEESEGAVIFKGEPYGLHTRVFINKEGIPTYEAKDVGLIFQKKKDYNFDKSVVITGNEQEQYMAVVLKAIEQFAPELVQATSHLTHGMVKLKGGIKMSSRKGNILRAVDVLTVAAEANKQATGNEDDRTVLGAVKYSLLKQRTGGDIIYDPEESVSIEGNSGPYLQYTHARARSILAKAPSRQIEDLGSLDENERSLARKISEYPEVVEKATAELMPHHVANYLYELAQTFNRFYEKTKVIGSDREAERLYIIHAYAEVLQQGLGLLNIAAPEKM